MVAVWDTVGALGVPFFSIKGISRSTFRFLHTGLRTMIEHGYHALAIDEHRKDFAPTLWTIRQPKDGGYTAPTRDIFQSVEQRWFGWGARQCWGRVRERSPGSESPFAG